MVYIILDDGRAERRAGGEQGGRAVWRGGWHVWVPARCSRGSFLQPDQTSRSIQAKFDTRENVGRLKVAD